MLSLTAQKREIFGKKLKALRKEGTLPAVLYGPKIKSLSLSVNLKEFEKIYKEARESTIIKLKISQKPKAEERLVLIKEVAQDPLKEEFLHVDFYQPSLEKEVEATIPLVFEGESEAVKDLGGTLIKDISEVTVKAKPQNLPHQIPVDIGPLKTFEDSILIKDLRVPQGVKIIKDPEETVASVARPEKVEEELEKPIEEKVEEVEKVEEKKEEKAEEIGK